MLSGSLLAERIRASDQPTRGFSARGRRSFGLAAAAWLAGWLAADAVAASPRQLLLDAAQAGSAIVCVGEQGATYRSVDGAQTWTAGRAVTRATLTGVSFSPDGQRGWAVGHDAVILVSEDGGVSWSRQWQGPSLEASFLDVCALSSTRAIAIGGYGLCLVTDDGGRTWVERKPAAEDMHLNRITLGPTGTLYIAGEHGTLLRSVDAGETWQALDSPYDGSLYGVLPLSADELLVYGLRGRAFASSDGGATWRDVSVDAPLLLATAVRLRTGAIVLAGQSRALFGARTGQPPLAPLPLAFTEATAELLETPDGQLLAFGEAGVRTVPLQWDQAR